MRLRECLELGALLQGDPETEIRSVVYDSRQAEPGSLFVAIPGFKADGHQFALDAIARGAVAVAVERPSPVLDGTAVLKVESSRQALSALAARLHGYPSRKLRVIGVTGTNGKTTTTHLIRSALMAQGHKVGLIGTVQNAIGDEWLPAALTTPQASTLQELMRRMVEAGCSHVVMEVSSEGLDLHRVDDVEFDVGVFTNLTQDHLNYHGTIERYREAKLGLFRSLSRPGVKQGKAAILNLDDASTGFFRDACTVPVHTYGLTDAAQVSVRDLVTSPTGSRFTLRTPQGEAPLEISLAGQFNVYNALAATAVCLLEGLDLPVLQRALGEARGVAGRMEPVRAGQPFGVFVDYAHSPDGLQNVLRAARGFARGRVILVFGCGGDRDRSKRPQMGRIAAELADYTVITSDNPRSEEPEAIIGEIEAGLRAALGPNRFYEAVADRKTAIERAASLCEPDDVLIIAGKGHETYQIFKDRTIQFDDREVARTVLQGWSERKGPA